MSPELAYYGLFAVIVLAGVAAVVGIAYKIYAGVKKGARAVGKLTGKHARAKQEALFTATFPELQPHFHPEAVLRFVKGWQVRRQWDMSPDWHDPPGFNVPILRTQSGPKGYEIQLRRDEGVMAQFLLQPDDEGAVVRLGQGKFTVRLRDDAVRYWHPEREFKWSRAKGFRLINVLSERPIESGEQGMSFSSDGSSSSTAYAATAAVAGGAVLGAGGAFDGGGSSESWDAPAGSRTSY